MSLGGDGDIIPAMASRYDDDLWELVPEFGSARPPPHIVEFVHSLGQAERALDIGCGDGRLTAELDALKLYAADVSPVALARARTRLGSDTQIVELDPDADLPLEDSQFDLVLCAETLEHVRDVQLLLSEVRRVLRAGGTFAVTTPAHSRLTGLRVLVRGFDNGFDPLSPHLRFFSKRSLVRLLGEMGYDVRAIRRQKGTLLAIARR
jgi:ubiquinone/menaquinone biosynthesis C-methylase UbiE